MKEAVNTKERPFKCNKCRSTFVRRDLLLRHDRTVHAKDGGVPLQSDGKRRSAGSKTSPDHSPNMRSADEDVLDNVGDANDPYSVEQAAMLMTNFQQRAALSGPDSAAIQPDPLLNSNNTIESSMPYAAHMTLPQMNGWDQMMPQNANSQPKPSSVSSSIEASHELLPGAHHTVPSAATLPPLIERQPSGTHEGLTAFQSSIPGGLDTPDALSPFTSMMGPVSPVDYRRSPGPPQPCTMAKAPQLDSRDAIALIDEKVRRADGDGALIEAFRLPELKVFNRYLNTYFNCFHHHLPFLHPASFDPAAVPVPLLLSVLSIGALYTFEQDQAYMLHIGSKILVAQYLQKMDNFSSRKCPLWLMQASLLNMSFASWSGDPKGLEWATSIKSLLANMVAGNKHELKLRHEARDGRLPTFEEWVEDEGCRRTYYAVYIFFGLLTLTYNHTPAISFHEFDSLELPSSETLWNFASADDSAWAETLTASPVITFRHAHDVLFGGELARYSAFATRVMINALFLEIWYHKRSPGALQDVVTEWKLRTALDTWEKSLELCEPETVIVRLSAPYKGHPLIFNAMAMYRNARARLLVDLKRVQEAMRYHDSYEVAAAMLRAGDQVKRGADMLDIIQACFDYVEVAVMQGIRWFARTSATNWSIEHPLCGLDLMVILTLWLWRVEHDDEPETEAERSMYKKLRGLFKDDYSDGLNTKLSSTVARLWGSMIDEVVVWGITKLMGESFKLHAQALNGYEDSLLSEQREGGQNAADAVMVSRAATVTAY
ncbi:hypothetical protein K470DRAFT_143800 [Piedraia hortae CBS 480.64]|uniref:C2H2-type domain-containing protein n=1 Tax=Piedraia hortae CBS 480.64 TaxID=1314780 RepID=A0A6A7C7P5_9PEZI|nr:hypothetical protein K470DRAFT_143800 [Piedraia hortae CBS 480.64]